MKFTLYLIMNSLVKIMTFNKKKIIILLLCSFLFANTKNTEAIGFGTSFGIMSERIPLSFFEMTAYYSPNDNTEIFGTFSYLVFGGGIGIGAKYYLPLFPSDGFYNGGNKKKERKKTSLFIAGGYSASFAGDDISYYVGPHISTGLSISFIDIMEIIGIDEAFNIFINLGGGHVFYEDIAFKEGWYPFLNGEMKIELDF